MTCRALFTLPDSLCRHHHDDGGCRRHGGPVVVIRPQSGLSGDMMVAGLGLMAGLPKDGLTGFLEQMNQGRLAEQIGLTEKSVNNISGFGLKIELPEEHSHRRLIEVEAFFGESRLTPRAKEIALAAFKLLAAAEGAVHGTNPAEVTFHEVGALDSLIDIGLTAALWDQLAPSALVCGPLPLADGVIACRHGLLPSPAPAVLKMLEGVPVCGFSGQGETVTPTALALLKALGACFGPWPAITVTRQALIYGDKIFEGAPNGTVFALGTVI